MDRVKSDQRILGNTSFVQAMLKEADEKFEHAYALRASGIDLVYIAKKSAELYGIEPAEIFLKNRRQDRADARGLFCYWAVRELNVSLSELARRLKMSPAGVGYAAARGESIVRDNDYQLLK